MLDKFSYKFNSEEKAHIISEVCRFTGKSSFLEVSEDGKGLAYMLLHNGTTSLSDIIANSGRSFYPDAEPQISDMIKAQEFAGLSRIGTLKRLFGMFYQSTRMEECVIAGRNFNYHTIDPDREEIRLRTQKSMGLDKGLKFLLINIKEGAFLYHSKETYTPSGCRRKISLTQAQVKNLFYVEAAKAALRGINHSRIDLYVQHQPMLYQSVEDFMEVPMKKTVPKPRCNFRPDC